YSLVSTHVPSGSGNTTRQDSAAVAAGTTVPPVDVPALAASMIVVVAPVRVVRMVSATGSSLRYRAGDAETSAAWAAAPLASGHNLVTRPTGRRLVQEGQA